MSTRPTLVFVPGAGHRAEVWNKVVALLEAQHFKCIPVTLPSTLSNPSATFFDDIKAVRDPIISETSEGRDVVVVVHSYGGAVGCSAVKGLTRPKKDIVSSTTETTGHVIGIASMASGFGPSGMTFADGLGGKLPPSWEVNEETGFADILAPPRETFYHDLPVEEGEYWVGKITKQAARPFMHPEGREHSYAGWMDVPLWYLATTDDRALPFEAQKHFIQMTKDAGGDITVREVHSSHSPMLSKPKETAKFIEEAAAAFVG
ncbi:alpha/beta-hydrolase [Stipitochalara longipes BDJ]|nr:alpha/beta-hydrolase [Stipitochalara longipes BDJ]